MKKPANCYEYWYECYARFNGNTVSEQLKIDDDTLPFYEWIHKQGEMFDKSSGFDSAIESYKFDNYLALISLNGPALYAQNNRGGKRPNAGAPKKAHPAKSRTIRLTDADWLKFQQYGGASWLRSYLQCDSKDLHQ